MASAPGDGPDAAAQEADAASRGWTWKRIADVAILVGLLVLAFFAIAETDPASSEAPAIWGVLAAVFAAGSLVMHVMHPGSRGLQHGLLVRLAATWLGVFLAIQVVFMVVETGRMAEGAAALMNGLIVGLGAYVSGVHTTWRFAVVGAALAAGVAVIALVEEYLWLLVGLGALAAAVMFLGNRVFRR